MTRLYRLSKRILFGPFEVDVQAGELRRQGNRIKLQEQPFQALLLMLERHGEVITREEFQRRLWPADTFVDFDRGLNKAISKLRDALGDDAETPRFVETLSQRGYRFIAAVEPVEPVDTPPSLELSPVQTFSQRRWLSVSILATLALLGIAIGLKVGGIRGRFFSSATGSPIRSIAVLPLQNLSDDATQQYFADGMTEELIGELARIGSLRVISRTSSMQFKGVPKMLPSIAKQLGVDAVLEGTVSRVGQKVRITAQLIDARDDVHVWSGRYERDIGDVLILQGEVAQAIANQIRIKLAPQTQTAFTRSRRVNPEAYEAYLNGNFYFDRPTEAGLAKSIEFFTEAIRLDASLAQAYAGLAKANIFVGIFGFGHPGEAFAKARVAATKALELDEAAPATHTVIAEIKKNDCDWAGAEAEYKRALELTPSYFLAHTWYAEFLSRLGRHNEAIAEAERARELDPISMISNTAFGMILYRSRRYDDAIKACRRALELGRHPNALWFQGLAHAQKRDFPQAIVNLEEAVRVSDAPLFKAALGHVYAVSGDKRRARSILTELTILSRTRYVAPANVALVHAGLGDRDAAFQWLEKAYREQKASITMLTWPHFDSLRSDPRTSDLLRRINLQPSVEVP
jgi:TolB-like protein/DNA-binding winged helix-turn-helix (wHTH) protein/Tfp pilus assembly protein PilF